MLLSSLALASSLTLAGPPTTALPPPRTPAPLDLPSDRTLRSNRIMLGISTVLFTGFYVAGTAVAAQRLDEIHADGILDRRERAIRRQSIAVFVPVVGPFVGAPMGSSKGDKIGFVATGVAQTLMASFTILSAVHLRRDYRARRLSLGASMSRTGAHAALRLRF